MRYINTRLLLLLLLLLDLVFTNRNSGITDLKVSDPISDHSDQNLYKEADCRLSVGHKESMATSVTRCICIRRVSISPMW